MELFEGITNRDIVTTGNYQFPFTNQAKGQVRYEEADPEDYTGLYPLQRIINGGLSIKL